MSSYPPPPQENPGGAAPYGAPGPGQPAPQYDPNAPQYGQPGAAPGYPQQPPAYGGQQPYDPNAPQYGQPQYGQQPYGQPPYGQPQYDPNAPQPPYGQPQYDPAQYGQIPPQGAPYGDPNAPWAFAPPPPKSRKGLKIGLSIGGAALLVIGGIAIYAVANVAKSTGEYKLVAPQTFQGLTRDDNSASAKSMAQSEDSGLAKAGVTPVITTYNTASGSPGLIFDGAYGDTLGASMELSQFWSGVTGSAQTTVSDKTNEPAGPLGGSMQCAILTFAGTSKVPTCVWADNSTYTAIMDFSFVASGSSGGDPTTELSATATKTLAMRAVAEVKK